MAVSILKNSSSEDVILEEGESANITATFYDLDGSAIAKANIARLTATLYDLASSTIINSRNAQDIKDTNGGSLTTAGVLTLKLQPADNAIVTVGNRELETHRLRLTWTWSDGDTRTGTQEFEFYVRNMVTPS